MTNMTRVLVIPSWYPPDGGYFFKEHSEALAEKGFDIDVLVNRITGITTLKKRDLKYLKRFDVTWDKGIRIIRSYYLRIPLLEELNVKSWILKTGNLFERYLKRFGRPDLIIAHSSIWAGCAAEHIYSRHKIPYIIIEHRSRFTGISENANRMFRDYYFPHLSKAFLSAARIVTVSDSLKKKILEIEPLLTGKLLTIPNQVDTTFFNMPEKPRQKEPFIIFSAGILEMIKGMDLLIRAFKGFLEECPGALLRIAGRGSLLRKLNKLAKDLKIENKVEFTGYLNREGILKEIHQANVLVLASRFEAFGVVLIEAMATGLPAIATRSGGPEYIITGNAGILTELENVDQLKVAMINMYKHYKEYDQEKIRKLILENYSREVVSDKYARLINEIL